MDPALLTALAALAAAISPHVVSFFKTKSQTDVSLAERVDSRVDSILLRQDVELEELRKRLDMAEKREQALLFRINILEAELLRHKLPLPEEGK